MRSFRTLWKKQPQTNYNSALLQAATDGDETKVKQLLSTNANVNAEDRNGCTPLFP